MFSSNTNLFCIYLIMFYYQNIIVLISKISLDYQYLSITDAGEYVISDANVNISFEVTEGTTFKILDENNKEVKAEIIENKIINLDGYDKGKKYVLSIENGNFVSEQLEDANEVTFKVARDEVKKYELKEDVDEDGCYYKNVWTERLQGKDVLKEGTSEVVCS